LTVKGVLASFVPGTTGLKLVGAVVTATVVEATAASGEIGAAMLAGRTIKPTRVDIRKGINAKAAYAALTPLD
jgi:hypothetical protein